MSAGERAAGSGLPPPSPAPFLDVPRPAAGLTPALADKLLVADGARRERPGAVAPSPLLARMQRFLPELAAANERLGGAGAGVVDSCVEIVERGEGRLGEESEHGISDEGSEVDDAAGLPVAFEEEEGSQARGMDAKGVGETSERRNTVGQSKVQMDIYIDGSLGELVKTEEESVAPRKLIEELPGSGAGDKLDDVD